VTHSPYKEPATNTIYDLLFCDDLELYRAGFAGEPTGPWQILFAKPPDPDALAVLASDAVEESRLRILAFNALDQQTKVTHPRELLGVIIEVGLDGGVDTLAAYQDLRARYINYSGKMIIWETREPTVDEKIRNLFAAAERVVEKIGPWTEPRLPPPANGLMRMTFLVSDGLYFGQGPLEALQQDPLAAPVVVSATEILLELTSRATME
jgi:hypothetical protein